HLETASRDWSSLFQGRSGHAYRHHLRLRPYRRHSDLGPGRDRQARCGALRRLLDGMGRPPRSSGGARAMSAKGTGKRRLPMTVTFLEMTGKPAVLPPPHPKGKVALLRCEKPSTHFYRYLYDTIGADYYWVDRKRLDPDGLTAVIQDPLNRLYVLYADGSPTGMAELDLRKAGTANISYFGL